MAKRQRRLRRAKLATNKPPVQPVIKKIRLKPGPGIPSLAEQLGMVPPQKPGKKGRQKPGPGVPSLAEQIVAAKTRQVVRPPLGGDPTVVSILSSDVGSKPPDTLADAGKGVQLYDPLTGQPIKKR